MATESPPPKWWPSPIARRQSNSQNRLSTPERSGPFRSQPETCDGMPSRTLLKILPPMVGKTECNLPVSMLQGGCIGFIKPSPSSKCAAFCAILSEAIVEEESCAAGLFRPICCSASRCGAGLVMPPTPAGRPCRSMTGCELSGSHRRTRWPLHACLAPKSAWSTLPTTLRRCLERWSGAMAIPRSAISRLTVH